MPAVKLDVVDGPVAFQQYGPGVQDVLLEQVRDEGVPLVLVGQDPELDMVPLVVGKETRLVGDEGAPRPARGRHPAAGDEGAKHLVDMRLHGD